MERKKIKTLREDARVIFQSGVDAAHPGEAVRRTLQFTPQGRLLIAGEALAEGSVLRIVAFGKAAVSMAEAAAHGLDEEGETG